MTHPRHFHLKQPTGWFAAGREIEHALAIEESQRVGDHQNGVRRLTIHRREGLVEIIGLTHSEWLHRDANLMRGFC